MDRKWTRILMTLVVALSMCVALPVRPAYAAACTFTSQATGNWNVAGTWTAVGTSCSSYPGQTYAGDTVVIAGGNTVTLNVSPANSIGSLTVNGTLSIGGYSITVTGATSVSGTLTHTSTSGTKTFTGNVTVNSGGTWNETAAAAISFGGSLQNDGTFTASTGVHTFSGTGSFRGTNDIAIPYVTINGTYTNELVDPIKLYVAKALSGSGWLTQTAWSVVQLGGTFTISHLDATSANNNHVVYETGAQLVLGVNYFDLFLYNDAKTLQTGTTHIYGSFYIGGGASTTTVGPLTIDQDLWIGDNPTFNAAGFPLTVGQKLHIGDGTSGIFNITSATGAKTFKDVYLLAGSTYNNSGNADVGVSGNWTNNGAATFTPGSGTITFNGTGAQTIGGPASTTFNNLTIANTSAPVLATNNFSIAAGKTLTVNPGAMLDADQYKVTGGSTTYLGGRLSNNETHLVGTSAVSFYDARNTGLTNPTVQLTRDSGSSDYKVTTRAGWVFPANDFGTTCPAVGNAVWRYYNIEPVSSGSTTVRLYYLDAELNGNTEGSLKIYHCTAGAWHEQVGTVTRDSTNNWVQVTGVTDFSPFILSSGTPTWAQVLSFRAAAAREGIALAWETASEVDTLGFNLYRARKVDGPRTLVNEDLIPTQVPGTSAGSVYRYKDLPVEGSGTYFYWLEKVDVSGGTGLFGPVKVGTK